MHNIKIDTQSKYLVEESDATNNQYVFAYQITIVNMDKLSCQLLNRHWYISDENGHIREVMGKGVVGEQPIIKQGEYYQYTSSVVLDTPTGSMHGSYGMVDEKKQTFNALIPKFNLLGPRTLH